MEFVPHVERTPLIRTMTLHVIAEALAASRGWRAAVGEIGVSVTPGGVYSYDRFVEGLHSSDCSHRL